ncbi:MAG: hypothetical protein JRH10_19585 [Deltaproteobacteria bacterium]|nr:hypothetical protein [Deltaproteobacteria bacterium]MBW2448783.1 hypothetical protein [Deltaproteobacteria bacterium]
MGAGRWLVGMELARARSAAPSALARAGDAYERARRRTHGPGGEAARPGSGEALWRALGRFLAAALAPLPGLRRTLEDRLLAEIPSSD